MLDNNGTNYDHQALHATVSEVMAIEDITEGVKEVYGRLLSRNGAEAGGTAEMAVPGEPGYVATGRGDAIRYRGRLMLPPDQAYGRLAQGFEAAGYTPLLRKDDDQSHDVVLALPGTLRRANPRLGVAALLFALTLVSCLFVGAQYVEGLAAPNYNLLDGLPYAASLLAILAAHELGHYFTARHFGSPTSLPYFIPMPIGLGTMGAFINMTAPPRNRRQLLAIAAAGPLAGLALAIPILWIGLTLSRVEPLPAAGGYQMEGNSLLYLALKYLVFGKILPSGGEDVFIHQVAFAGWVGLLVTGLNLIPAGQLDGGHIVYALVGEKRARYIQWVVLALLAGLSFVYTGWLLWLFLILLLGRFYAAPLDELTQLTGRQRALAVAMVALFVLVFTPIPFKIVL